MGYPWILHSRYADLKLKAKNNTYIDFKYAFDKTFENTIAQEFEKNQAFYGEILKDESFKSKLMSLIGLDIYESFKKKSEINKNGINK